MKNEKIAFRARVGIGQIYTKDGFLYQDGVSIGKILSIHQVESNLNGEVFLVGWYLPQAIETTEPAQAVGGI